MPIGISQSTDLDFYLLQKPLTDTPRNNVLPANWASFSPVKFTHKINHRSLIFQLWKNLIYFLSNLKQFLVLIFFWETVKTLPLFFSARHQLHIPFLLDLSVPLGITICKLSHTRTHWCCIRKGGKIKRDKIILDGLVNHFLAVCVGRWISYFWILHLWDRSTQWRVVMASATFLALCRHIISDWGHMLVSYRWISQMLKICCYVYTHIHIFLLLLWG